MLIFWQTGKKYIIFWCAQAQQFADVCHEVELRENR